MRITGPTEGLACCPGQCIVLEIRYRALPRAPALQHCATSLT
jgi:hypothetical protein